MPESYTPINPNPGNPMKTINDVLEAFKASQDQLTEEASKATDVAWIDDECYACLVTVPAEAEIDTVRDFFQKQLSPAQQEKFLSLACEKSDQNALTTFWRYLLDSQKVDRLSVLLTTPTMAGYESLLAFCRNNTVEIERDNSPLMRALFGVFIKVAADPASPVAETIAAICPADYLLSISDEHLSALLEVAHKNNNASCVASCRLSIRQKINVALAQKDIAALHSYREIYGKIAEQFLEEAITNTVGSLMFKEDNPASLLIIIHQNLQVEPNPYLETLQFLTNLAIYGDLLYEDIPIRAGSAQSWDDDTDLDDCLQMNTQGKKIAKNFWEGFVAALEKMTHEQLDTFIQKSPSYLHTHPRLLSLVLKQPRGESHLGRILQEYGYYLLNITLYHGDKPTTLLQGLLDDDVSPAFIKTVLRARKYHYASDINRAAISQNLILRLNAKLDLEDCIVFIENNMEHDVSTDFIEATFARLSVADANSDLGLRLIAKCIKCTNNTLCSDKERILTCVMDAITRLGVSLQQPALAELRRVTQRSLRAHIDSPNARAFFFASHTVAGIKAAAEDIGESVEGKQALCFDKFIGYFANKYRAVKANENVKTDPEWVRYSERLERFMVLRNLIKETQRQYPDPTQFSIAFKDALAALPPLSVRTFLWTKVSSDRFNGLVNELKDIPAPVLLIRLDEIEIYIHKHAGTAYKLAHPSHPISELSRRLKLTQNAPSSTSSSSSSSSTATPQTPTSYLPSGELTSQQEALMNREQNGNEGTDEDAAPVIKFTGLGVKHSTEN